MNIKEVQRILLKENSDLSAEDIETFLGKDNTTSEKHLLEGIESVRIHMSITAVSRLEDLSQFHSSKDVREAAKNALKTCRDGISTESYQKG